MNHLHTTTESKYHGLLSTYVLLQHNDACLHTGRSTVETIQDLSSDCFPHHIFGSLKEAVWGGGDLSSLMKRWSRQYTGGYIWHQKTFFTGGIHALLKCWNTYIIVCHGDYIAKWCMSIPIIFNTLHDKKNKKYLRFSFDSPLCIETACINV